MTEPCNQCVPQFAISPCMPVQCCGMGLESPRDRLIRECTDSFFKSEAFTNAARNEKPYVVIDTLMMIRDHANALYPTPTE